MKGGSNSEKVMAALGLASRSVVGVSGPASSPSYTSTSPGTGHTETLPTEELADRVGRSMSQGSSTWLNYVSAALVIAVICIHFGLGDRVATIIVGTFAALGLLWLIVWSRHRGKICLRYDLDDATLAHAADAVGRVGEALSQTSWLWEITSSTESHDHKRNAGVGTLVNRREAQCFRFEPRWLDCNVEVWAIRSGDGVVILFPECVVFWAPHDVIRVPHTKLRCDSESTLFVEEGPVPADTDVVGRTWEYVNKSGGPDRRYKDNRELPRVEYGQLTFRISGEAPRVFQLSAPACADAASNAFAAALDVAQSDAVLAPEAREQRVPSSAEASAQTVPPSPSGNRTRGPRKRAHVNASKNSDENSAAQIVRALDDVMDVDSDRLFEAAQRQFGSLTITDDVSTLVEPLVAMRELDDEIEALSDRSLRGYDGEMREGVHRVTKSLRDAMLSLPADLAEKAQAHVHELAGDPGKQQAAWKVLAAEIDRLIEDPSRIQRFDETRVLEALERAESEEVGAADDFDEESIVGQKGALSTLDRIVATAEFARARAGKGLASIPVSFHAVFSGNPGTGKTTLARLYATKLREAGCLRKGHLVEVSRGQLVAGYLGQTAVRTREKLEEARGGILFIDEAYGLKTEGHDSYGQECINTLVKYMEDHRDDIVVIAAGYPDEMREFLATNPGLKSRFTNWVDFEDFSDDELSRIFDGLCERHGMSASAETRTAALLQVEQRQRGGRFANGRAVRNVFERGVQLAAVRLGADIENANAASLGMLAPEDFADGSVSGRTGSDVDDRKAAIERLEALRGLQGVKQELIELRAWIEIQRRRQENVALPDLNLHMAFVGNPGTGKTTVARLLGEILKEFGFLSSGHVVEVDRSSLVAGYVGQTAIKATKAFERSLGGILFIDEAYSLVEGRATDHNFGQEAIDTILKLMEDHRENSLVIVAGYPEPMSGFLSSNPGLRSRFSKTVHFEDYGTEELVGILEDMAKSDGYELTREAVSRARLVIMQREGDPNFANARDVRQLYESSQRKQAVRLVKMGATSDRKALHQLSAEDFVGDDGTAATGTG